mgnify:CR=1 FL=1
MSLTAKGGDALRYQSPTVQAAIRERETSRAKASGESVNQNLRANILTDDGEHRELRLTSIRTVQRPGAIGTTI